ncbi:MAG TPA: hypothetical protein VMZ04_06180 [Anaerolineae bacterium]|nr:hypothetical protein [Anaerolineae bacterium]
MLEIIVDSEHELTIYRCSGCMTEEELTHILQSLYTGTFTLNILWDYSEASLEGISSEFVRQIHGRVQKLGSARLGGKSAIVATKELEYGLARMFQIMADENGFPLRIKLFRSIDEAHQWLLENDQQSGGR